MPRREGMPIPEEAKKEMGIEANPEAKEATPEGLEQNLEQQANLQDRLEHGPVTKVKDALQEAGVELEGKSPDEIADDAAKKLPKKSNALKRLILTGLTIGSALAGPISSAVAREVQATEMAAEGKMTLARAVEVIKNYLSQMQEINGLSQEEGKLAVDYMIKAAKSASEQEQSEEGLKKELDGIMDYVKFVKQENPGLGQGLSALEYGLAKIAGEEAPKTPTNRAEEAFEELDQNVDSMEIFLNPDSTFEQRIQALEDLNLRDGESIDLNGVRIGRKGDDFFWIKYGNMGTKLNKENSQKLAKAYQKAMGEIMTGNTK